MQEFAIIKTGQSSTTTQVAVHELEQIGQPSIVYLRVAELPDADKCKAVKADLVLPAATFTEQMVVVFDHYVLRTSNLDEAYRLYAHYGLFRAASFDFDAADTIASSDTNYLYELSFKVINVQRLINDNARYFAGYYVQQQISFDIGEYDSNNRRLDLVSYHSSNEYDKLSTRLRLDKNVLSVQCLDTNGRSASQHLAEQANVAEETIQCSCIVRLKAIDVTGATLTSYSLLAANEDYSDNILQVALPSVNNKTAAAEISISYIIEIMTTGEVITMSNRIILTDEQIANLMLTYGLGKGLNIDDLLEEMLRQQATLKQIALRRY